MHRSLTVLCEPYVRALGHIRSFVRDKVSPSNISRTVWPRLTKFHIDIHTDLFYNTHDMTSLTIIPVGSCLEKTCWNYRLQRLLVEFLENGSSTITKFIHLSGIIGSTNLSDMTSSATSGRHFSKFEKRPKMPPAMALGRILVTRC